MLVLAVFDEALAQVALTLSSKGIDAVNGRIMTIQAQQGAGAADCEVERGIIVEAQVLVEPVKRGDGLTAVFH